LVYVSIGIIVTVDLLSCPAAPASWLAAPEGEVANEERAPPVKSTSSLWSIPFYLQTLYLM